MDKIKLLKNKSLAFILFTIALVICSSHDFYILPEKYFLTKGDTLRAHLYVGDEFKTDEERSPEKKYATDYVFISNTNTLNLHTFLRDSVKPFFKKVMDTEGLGLIAIARNKIHAKITMTPEKFTSYLKEEKLDGILKLRDSLPPKKEEREKYTRYLKSLVMVGNAKGNQYKQKLGHALEIILLDNPYTTKIGKAIMGQLFFKGTPLYNGSIEIVSQNSEKKVTVLPIKTDKDGKFKFVLDNSGQYLVRITYMLPCKNCEDADWESWWASYSFGVK